MINENYFIVFIITAIGMFSGATLFAGTIYIGAKLFRNISPFKEVQKKIGNIIMILGNTEEMNKTYETIKYINSISLEIYSRLNMIADRLEELEQKKLGEVLNEEIIEKSEDETIMEYYENLSNESMDDFIREKSISKDDFPHELSIERSIVEDELGYSKEDYNYIHESITNQENIEDEVEYRKELLENSFGKVHDKNFIVEDDERLPFIENTITNHEGIKPISTEDFKSLTPEEKKEYVSAIMKQNYDTVEDVPDKLREVISSLDKFCNSNKIIESNDEIVIKKDFDTGRYKFDIKSNIEKVYMDHERNDANGGYYV